VASLAAAPPIHYAGATAAVENQPELAPRNVAIFNIVGPRNGGVSRRPGKRASMVWQIIRGCREPAMADRSISGALAA
jgi:hypothetical protein